MFGIADAGKDLRLAKTNMEAGLTQVTFQQVHQGVPVLYSGYLVSFDAHGVIHYVSGDYFPEIQVDTQPSFSQASVAGLAGSDLGKPITLMQAPELVVYVDRSADALAYHLAYHTQAISVDSLEAAEYVFDAHTGKLLYKADLIEHIDGSGKVYRVHPTYQSLITVTLPRLLNTSPRRLDGDNINSNNYTFGDATSTTGQFYYGATDPHFDDVMVYYHSDDFEVFMIGNGMEQTRVAKVTSYTRYPGVFAGSIPASRELRFGPENLGNYTRNPTHEAAVIQHEYMHVVSETYNTLTQNNEADAMDESYSDYFALAAKNRYVASSVVGEYVDMPGGCVIRRNLVNTYTYSQLNTNNLDGCGGVDEHDRSVIFSGGLWDFRRSSGVNPATADKIIRASLGNLDSSPSFLDGRNAVISAANTMGYSSYRTAIETAFANHGIGTVTPPPPTAPPAAPTGFTVSGSPGQHPVLSWSAASGATGYKIYRCLSTSTSCSNFSYVTSTSNTSYTDLNRTVGSSCSSTSGEQFTYYYVKAYNSIGTSPASATKSTCTGNNKQEAADLVAATQELLPSAYALEPNYPNPFNPTTEIRFALPEGADVRLIVYDALGREVARLVDGPVGAGYQHATFEAGSLPSGVYLYRLEAKGSAETFAKTGRMVLVK